MTKTLAILILAASCGKGSDHQAAATAPADKPAETPVAKLVYKPLGALGLEAEVPDDAKIDDDSKSAGFPSVTVWQTPTTFIMGAGDDSPNPQTIDAAKKEVQSDANAFQKFTKQDATADGWVLEYELQSAIDKATIYGYKRRFKLDNKLYECGSNGRSTAERDAVIKLCTSIRKKA